MEMFFCSECQEVLVCLDSKTNLNGRYEILFIGCPCCGKVYLGTIKSLLLDITQEVKGGETNEVLSGLSKTSTNKRSSGHRCKNWG